MPCGCEKRRKALRELLKRIVPARKPKPQKTAPKKPGK